MKFFEKLILIETKRRKRVEMSDDEIEKDQADREQDDEDAEVGSGWEPPPGDSRVCQIEEDQ